ncbi:MAG: peptide chain release factor N(5)-glutamine methyltransferase [Campylobacterales bacterium]|nr:peptide chain release factor N(5)-glutamine methyltransferase [Campylobacterales bacterium]
MKKVSELLAYGVSTLKETSQRPRLESEILLAYALKKERVWLHTYPEVVVDESPYIEMIHKRRENYPLEYITGTVSFYGETFYTSEGVLIPRPETETLVELASKEIGDKPLTICEVGVGSGIISIILAKLNPHITIIGTDINPKAIELSKKNAKKFNVINRIDFRLGSILEPVNEKIDILVSNPPYIADDYQLPENVKYEPKEALFGGIQGDELIQEIIENWYKKDISHFFCEYGYDQKSLIAKYIEKYDDVKVLYYKDLAGLNRGFILKKI